MQTQIHKESLMISMGMMPVPKHMYRRKVVDSLVKKRRMTEEERISLLYSVAKHIVGFNKVATAEFIYYEMLDNGELPTDDGVVLVTLNNFYNYYKSANYQVTGKYSDEQKICERCGKSFERRITIPYHRFKKQRFCSKKCACLNTVANRVSNNEKKEA